MIYKAPKSERTEYSLDTLLQISECASEKWKSVDIYRKYWQEYSGLVFDSQCIIIAPTLTWTAHRLWCFAAYWRDQTLVMMWAGNITGRIINQWTSQSVNQSINQSINQWFGTGWATLAFARMRNQLLTHHCHCIPHLRSGAKSAQFRDQMKVPACSHRLSDGQLASESGHAAGGTLRRYGALL